jgi:hypothetical protein
MPLAYYGFSGPEIRKHRLKKQLGSVRIPLLHPVVLAQAALLGVHTTGFPVSPLTPATFLVVGLADISLAQHQRLRFRSCSRHRCS